MVSLPCPLVEEEERRRKIQILLSMQHVWPARPESRCTFLLWEKRRYPIRAQPWVAGRPAVVPTRQYRDLQMFWPWLKISRLWEWITFRWLTKRRGRKRHSFV